MPVSFHVFKSHLRNYCFIMYDPFSLQRRLKIMNFKVGVTALQGLICKTKYKPEKTEMLISTVVWLCGFNYTQLFFV